VTTSSEQTGSLEAAIRHTEVLLDKDPVLAIEQAQEILATVPNYPPADLLLASALHRTGQTSESLSILARLVLEQSKWAAAHFEYGIVLSAVGRGDEALAAMQKTVDLKPQHSEAWRYLGDHLMATGQSEEGDRAYARHVQASAKNPALQQAAAAMIAEDVAMAEKLLKAHLKQAPTDVPAIRMLAEVAVRCGENEAAESLLLRCLELAPSFTSARYNYAVLLHRRNDSTAALGEVEQLLEVEPRSPSYRNLCAVILSRVGEYERSSSMYKELLNEYPENAKVWLSYGHVLKTEGRQDDCIDAYRISIQRDPGFGEAYWSLANLKTFQFSDSELAAMASQLEDEKVDDVNRLHIHFALGKAAEDAADFEESFKHYALGNKTHNESIRYDAQMNSARSERLQKTFTKEFFAQRAGVGHTAQDPIFIVGMPRSGSTLLEQILSSHSQVEGTTELPDIITMAKELREQAEAAESEISYDDVLSSMNVEQLKAMGERYIETTRIHRKTDKPFFVDKMPNNFLHIGMIHLILPNAKIIDARRHPLGCSFSNFKQYYARGQSFSYSLEDMGHFYRDYVELMDQYDKALPGRVYRAFYEQTVADTENQVRGILDYCGLPFEEACMRFFENKRAVRTASSEQVRQPIYTGGVEQWKNYEIWLDPLKQALGPVLKSYPFA